LRAGAFAGAGAWRFAATLPVPAFLAAVFRAPVFFAVAFFAAAFVEVAVAPRRTTFFAAGVAAVLDAMRFFATPFFAAAVLRAAGFDDATVATDFLAATFFAAAFLAVFFVATFLAAAFAVAAFLAGAFCADAAFTAPPRGAAAVPLRDVAVLPEPVRVLRVAISASIDHGRGYRGMPGIQAG
jgi:hypothetical protein